MDTPAERPVIDFDETMTSGVITEVKEPTAEEKAAQEAEVKKKIDDAAAAKKKAESDEEDEEEDESDDKKKDESEEEGEEEEENEGDDNVETDEEKKAKNKKAKKDEEDEGSVSADEFVKNEYSEKYELNTKDELDELIEVGSAAILENKELKEQLKKAGDTKPKFASPQEEKAFDLVKTFANLEDGATAMGRLLGMDVEKADAKNKLELQFILENPEITTDKAREQFERHYKRKYTVKEKDKYDSDADFEDAKLDAETDLERDGKRAEKYLKAKQEEVRMKPTTEKKAEEEKVPEVIQKSIEKNASDLTKYAEGFNQLTFSPDPDDESNDFTFKLKKEQAKAVVDSATNWVNNPAMYDEKGKFRPGLDPEEVLIRTTYAMLGPEIFSALTDHMHTIANVKGVQAVSKKKPNDKSKAKGDVGDLSIEDQAERLAVRKKKERVRVA